jgi:hypothetical protein
LAQALLLVQGLLLAPEQALVLRLPQAAPEKQTEHRSDLTRKPALPELLTTHLVQQQLLMTMHPRRRQHLKIELLFPPLLVLVLRSVVRVLLQRRPKRLALVLSALPVASPLLAPVRLSVAHPVPVVVQLVPVLVLVPAALVLRVLHPSFVRRRLRSMNRLYLPDRIRLLHRSYRPVLSGLLARLRPTIRMQIQLFSL